MRPLVSVIIPFYNCPYVDQAVRSVLAQSYSPVEIIVVDDGSTQFQERLDPYRSRIIYLGKANGGTASALNHGIRHASGQYIAWLSSDDLFYPDKINNQVCFMLEQQVYISHTNFDYIDLHSNITRHGVAPLFANLKEFYTFFLTANPVNGCTVMFRKELFERLGLFDESLPYTHDVDFWYRAIVNGYTFPFLNQSLVGYRWHGGMGTLRYRDVIQREYDYVQGRTRARMEQFLNTI